MSSKPSINIGFQTDDGHAWMTSIALRSLIAAFEHSPNSQTYSLRIIFVSHGLNAENAALLQRNCRSESVEVHHETVDCPLKATIPAERRIELFTLRLHFPEVLPHLDRLLFLDSDILVVDDISKLWEVDLRGHWLGAAACLNTSDDVCLRNYNNEFKIQFKQAIDPINGGVALLDLKKMRELHVTQSMLDWLHAHRDTTYNPDQEAISMHCGGQFTALPPEWNFRLFAEPYWTSSWRGYREYIKLKPSLVHFQDPLRPNLLRGNLPYFSEWIACHNEVMQSELKSARRISYFMFVYFEFYFIITWLAGGIASYRWRTFLTGVALLPYSLLKYTQYALSPETYRFRISKELSRVPPAKLGKNQLAQASPR